MNRHHFPFAVATMLAAVWTLTLAAPTPLLADQKATHADAAAAETAKPEGATTAPAAAAETAKPEGAATAPAAAAEAAKPEGAATAPAAAAEAAKPEGAATAPAAAAEAAKPEGAATAPAAAAEAAKPEGAATAPAAAAETATPQSAEVPAAAPDAKTPPTAPADKALGGSATATGGAAEAVWNAYEKRWAETSSYVAGFRQTIEVPDVGTKVESAGRFYFSKPDKVQWEYSEGPPQKVVGDGQWLWLYQPDLEQVYKIPYAKAFGRGGLVALLAGREGVSERYRASLDDGAAGTVRIRLTALDKVEGDLEVTLTAGTFDLREVVVHDPAGSVTKMVFSDPVRNHPLAPALFTFTPPDGVDIITDHETGF